MITSFRNDIARLEKEMEISTYSSLYNLSVPGPGLNLPFVEDPQIRLQYWGANRRTNFIGIENELTGRTLTHANSKPIVFQSQDDKYKVMESRTTNPSWMYRGHDQQYTRFEELWINPQNDIERNFSHNVQTRLTEKYLQSPNEFHTNLLPI